jgi:hypothetical protein
VDDHAAAKKEAAESEAQERKHKQQATGGTVSKSAAETAMDAGMQLAAVRRQAPVQAARAIAAAADNAKDAAEAATVMERGGAEKMGALYEAAEQARRAAVVAHAALKASTQAAEQAEAALKAAAVNASSKVLISLLPIPAARMVITQTYQTADDPPSRARGSPSAQP